MLEDMESMVYSANGKGGGSVVRYDGSGGRAGKVDWAQIKKSLTWLSWS